MAAGTTNSDTDLKSAAPVPKSLRLILKPGKRKVEETEDAIPEPPRPKKRQRRRSIKFNKKRYDDSSSDENYIQNGFKTLSGRTVINPNTWNKTIASTFTYGADAGDNDNDNAQSRPTTSSASVSNEPDEASCVVCLRTPDTPDNQIVFCDGCDEAYHQDCHVPEEEEEEEEGEGENGLVEIINGYPGSESRQTGESLTEAEKLIYLDSLPREKLISMILLSNRLAPGLPIFPQDIREIITTLKNNPIANLNNNEVNRSESITSMENTVQEDANTRREKPSAPPPRIVETDEDCALWRDDPDNPGVSHRIYSISGIKVQDPKGWIRPEELSGAAPRYTQKVPNDNDVLPTAKLADGEKPTDEYLKGASDGKS
ncbi:hypothetical protein ABW20_dc0109710 [Dactylellina cionopaga]|nr:hypothetical protein ABW20_dc0109710 [Dactylellina cionopaga]